MASEQFLSSTFELAAQEIERLTASGFVGFFDRFEATEIIAIRDGQSPINLLSLFVAEDGHDTQLASLQPLGERLRCKEMREWTFGVFRYEIGVDVLNEHLLNFSSSQVWDPSGKILELSVNLARPPLFVPVDSTGPVALNSVLKNNFWNGSHVVELVDNTKSQFAKFYDDPSLLRLVASLVEQQIPMGLSGLSDRLGNVLIQVPVTIAMTTFGLVRESKSLFVDVSWHKRAIPRPLRVCCEIPYDDVVSAFAVADLTSGRALLPVRHTDRAFLARVWDAANGTLLSASGPSAFVKQVGIDTGMITPEARIFMVPRADGSLEEKRIAIQTTETNTSIIGNANITGLEWTAKRLYKADIDKATAEKRLVAYGPHLGEADAERQRALEDIRGLIHRYGAFASWIWDPFLSADDLLETLFFCTGSGSDLRALSAGARLTDDVQRSTKEDWIIAQRDRLNSAKGNTYALRTRIQSQTWT